MPSPTASTSSWARFGQGVLAALAGTAAGHLVAALTVPASSPVTAVGTAVINLTPTPVKVWAVRELGSADKPVLIGSVLAVTLVLAGVAGVIAQKRFAVGAGLLVLLVGLATLAAVVQPAAGVVDALPGVVTALVGLGVLVLLVRGGGSPRAAVRGSTPAHEDGEPAPSRRAVLVASGVVVVAAAAVAGAGQLLVRARGKISDLALPTPADPLSPLPQGIEASVEGVSTFQTARDKFYRVDTNLTVPVVDVESWSLKVDGDVENELEITYDELIKLPVVERDITMTCVSNEVGGNLVGAGRWLGVPLREVLDRAGVGGKADQILSTAVDGFTISTPLDVALDGRNTLIAFALNGEPLPREHGYPVRLVTPGIYGYVGSTKWLERLTLTTFAAQEAYWTKRKWAEKAPIKLSSRVDTPRPLSTIDAGETVIAGVAWAQPDGVAKVEVNIDDEGWKQAKLGPDAGSEYWRQWYLPWQAASGSHQIAVRATNKSGEVQTEERATPFPDGSSGIQQIVVNVG